ncbi:exo-alpha-sialidase [bacterium]|nr:exo-alpha-sialidase [bacterium]
MPLLLYEPDVRHESIYVPHRHQRPLLLYNHDVDIVRFRGRFIAAWNANATPLEGVAGQFNYLSVSPDFRDWTPPVRPFCRDGGCENPVEDDNQWQPVFVNYRDESLFCAWCTVSGRRTFVSHSRDGVSWVNRDVAPKPLAVADEVVGFPTTHGLVTSDGAILIPCSLPGYDCQVHRTRYAGILISRDGGENWHWSQPIEGVNWSELGEDPAAHGGDTMILWEPVVFEEEGGLGLLVRNSTSQGDPYGHRNLPWQMILYAHSEDGGETWSRALPVEVNSTFSRMLAVSGWDSGQGMMMVHNDWDVAVPEPIPRDRYFMSLFVAPTCDPNLLLPGPCVQLEGGRGYYPNGFVTEGRLYLGYTYNNTIQGTVVHPLPDFSRPFLLPRQGRPGLRIESGRAFLTHPSSTLGVVLTPEMTRKGEFTLEFALTLDWLRDDSFPLLTLGGVSRLGSVLRVCHDGQCPAVKVRDGDEWVKAGDLPLGQSTRVSVQVGRSGFRVTVGETEKSVDFERPLLPKVAFGGLYEPSPWPMGEVFASGQVTLDLESIRVAGLG